VQIQTWTKIIAGEHVLITAPTGSGKTLAAFMWAINQLVTEAFTTGYTRVLYISPLKALNNDIQRNLLRPLSELKDMFEKGGESFPALRVLTRSGDTPQTQRRQMQRHPPDILITTPESLNLLLSSPGGRSILTNLATVILDELHAVVGNKRGVHLITAVDRLVQLGGEFQRIALSATLRPLNDVAEFVGGYKIDGNVSHPHYTLRPVSVIRSERTKTYDIQIKFPAERINRKIQDSIWEPLVEACKKVISANRSTLIFVNSRRLCEKITLKINHGEEQPIAYAHHGSLSREIRAEVERKLKAGDLRAIVATNSLELGIDIGVLDEVILIQSPFSISSGLQRIGRAGHQVGEVSRGILFPTHPWDLLEAAILASGILQQDIEAIKPVQCPLDVLAQIIVSMVGVEMWNIDALFAYLKTSHPYQYLSRKHFDLVLNMLGGRYADSRIRELRPRVSIDRLDNTVTASRGAMLALYTSGGTIPDRGYYNLRHFDTHAKIGDLDEEFVWEAVIGQTLTLGTQNWKIQRITHNDVFVGPGPPNATAAPFWKGEQNSRNFHFSERIGIFLEMTDGRLNDPELVPWLQQDYCMDPAAAVQLIDFLKKQKEVTGCHLPHRHHILIEFSSRGPGSAPGNQVMMHTLWGGRVNRPFAMALDAAWEAQFGQRVEIFAGNDSIALLMPHEVQGHQLLSLVGSAEVESLLRKQLEGSGFFGARFRECAGRSLLMTRSRFNERMPLWMSRLRSQKLLESVHKFDDFPILLETWRTCLQDEFDIESLQQVLTEIEQGAIRWTEVRTQYPSPLAQSVSWSQINQYMYMDDKPSSGRPSKLRGDLLRDVVFTPGLRPAVSRKIIREFELKRQRFSPGYAPQTSQDLLDWAKERLLIPFSEWMKLLQVVQSDDAIDPAQLINPVAQKLVKLHPSKATEPLVVSLEMLPRIMSAFYKANDSIEVEGLLPASKAPDSYVPGGFISEEDRDEALELLIGQWLQFYGPTTVDFLYSTLGIQFDHLQLVLEDLMDSQKVIAGQLVIGGNDNDICDSENFEILLRLMRIESTPSAEPLDIEWLQLFLAKFQGITDSRHNRDGLFRCLEQLVCYPAKAGIWETEILPSRLTNYDLSWLDNILQEEELMWRGQEMQRIAFCFKPEQELMQDDENDRSQSERKPLEIVSETNSQSPDEKSEPVDASMNDLFEDVTGRYDFSTLLRKSKYKPGELAARLWEMVWLGAVTNDTFITLRQAIENRFHIPKVAEGHTRAPHRLRRSGVRSGFNRWKSALPYSGNWYRIYKSSERSNDLLEVEERKKDRVRLLLDRYGILFRELLEKELPVMRWSAVFRSMRLMELSGEILAGYFFHGIPGPQFISHQAFQMLQQKLPKDAVYWINAKDPVSLCGIQLDAIKTLLPKRLNGTHLIYRGSELVLVSKRNGRSLIFFVSMKDSRIQEYLCSLRHLLTRAFQPLRRITVETINGVDAARSEFVAVLQTAFDVLIDYKQIVLYRKL
jgi:ATP-dependent Lhr-like helicase